MKLLETNRAGVILYVHSDNNHIHILYKDIEEQCLKYEVVNKGYNHLKTVRIDTSAVGKELGSISWHRALAADGQSNVHIFQGCVEVDGRHYRFTIPSDNPVLELGDEVSLSPVFKFEFLTCLNSISVEHHVQRGNTFYVTGLDRDYKEQVFLEVCVARDKALRRYHLRSDIGDLNINTINLDSADKRIYLAGESCVYNDETGAYITSHPYFETLQLTQLPK